MPKSIKKLIYEKGKAVPVYAKGLSKSKYIMSIRDKEEYNAYQTSWREKNRIHYNKYHKKYYKANKSRFDTTIKRR